MASLDKSSVRQEVIRLKGEFEQLRADGKISHETQTVPPNTFIATWLAVSECGADLRQYSKDE